MIKLFEKFETEKYIVIKILFIKITFKKKTPKSYIDVIAWFMPFGRLREAVREYLLRTEDLIGGLENINNMIDWKINMIDEKIKRITAINYQLNMSKNINYNTFLKYKNINQGKEVVLIATGPTLNKYIPIKNALNVGVNQAIYYDKVKLDYYFLQDCKNSTKDVPEFIINNDDGKCQYFFGVCDIDYMKDLVSESDAILIKNAKRYVLDILHSHDNLIYDITSLPLADFESVVFEAIQFIFWTNPKRIYLVGCDVSESGHFNQKNNTLNISRVKLGWLKVKEFRDIYYPKTEIVSINPIGLNGIFKEIYSKNGCYIDTPSIDDYKEYFRNEEYLNAFLENNRMERMDANREDIFAKVRADFHKDRYFFASKYVENKIVIDTASGTGYGADILYNIGKAKKVYGIEINDKTVAYAQYKYGNDNIIYNQGSILDLPFDNEMFDVFTSFETVEHVDDEDRQMKEVRRVLKKGGLYILSTPNNWGLTEFHVKDYDYFSIKELVSKYFKIQKIYNQNSETATTKRQIIETTENNYKEAECFIIVAIKE